MQCTDANKDEVAKIVSNMLQEEAGVRVTPAEFSSNWNRIESFPASPQAAKANLLDPAAKNYLPRRWEDCNTYYLGNGTISQRVDPKGVFPMGDVQATVEAAVGN